MRIFLKTIHVFVFLSISSIKIAENKATEVFPTTVRFTPQTKTETGGTGSDNVEKVAEIPVPRHARSLKNCRYPKLTEDSDIFCKIYPSKIVCNQTCMFGHTLKEGITRTMHCLFNEDEWKPVRKFESCKPFVDCTVSLGPGGRMTCYSNFMDHGPICEISCQHYEDREAVPTKKYQCNIEGVWHPRLPFCALPGTNLDLVPSPF